MLPDAVRPTAELIELIRVGGLPAHPLIVHGAVVLIPLAALAGVAYVVPRWRTWLRWPMVAGAVLAFVFVWAAYLTGENFRDSVTFFRTDPQVSEHQEYAEVLRILTSVFAVAAAALGGWGHRLGARWRTGAIAVVALLAVATLVYVVLTGESGARAVWSGSY